MNKILKKNTKEAVVVLIYVPKFFDTPLFKKWRLIPLSLSVGKIGYLLKKNKLK